MNVIQWKPKSGIYYLKDNGSWSEDINQAKLFNDSDAEIFISKYIRTPVRVRLPKLKQAYSILPWENTETPTWVCGNNLCSEEIVSTDVPLNCPKCGRLLLPINDPEYLDAKEEDKISKIFYRYEGKLKELKWIPQVVESAEPLSPEPTPEAEQYHIVPVNIVPAEIEKSNDSTLLNVIPFESIKEYLRDGMNLEEEQVKKQLKMLGQSETEIEDAIQNLQEEMKKFFSEE